MNEHEQRVYNKLMRLSKSVLFSLARQAGVAAPRGYCWTVGGEIQCTPPNEGGPMVPGASQDDAARALAGWFLQ